MTEETRKVQQHASIKSTATARVPLDLVNEKSIEEILDDCFALHGLVENDGDSKTGTAHQRMTPLINHHLPASYRTRDQELRIPVQDIEGFLRQELDLKRLNDMFDWLWLAGRPMPPRALHYQKYLERDIIIVSKLDMHLTWAERRMYISPLPRYLLSSSFWRDNLVCRTSCKCRPTPVHGPQRPSNFCQQQNFRRVATGFLFSYAGLIVNEYDFQMAQNAMLIPRDITWAFFHMLLQGIFSKPLLASQIDRRFVFGELRLSRLDKIRHLRGFLRGYQQQYPSYAAFWRDNLNWLAAIIGYVLLVLTAMQVGLATEILSDNIAFQSASFGFTVFAILGPLGLLAGIVLLFLLIFVSNLQSTRRFRVLRWQKLFKTDREQ